MDPMGTPRNNMTAHGITHGLLGGIVFLLMPTICYVFYFQNKKKKEEKHFNLWSLSMAILLTITLIAFTAITKSKQLNELFYDWQGFFQRLVIIPFMLWLFTLGLRYKNKSTIH